MPLHDGEPRRRPGIPREPGTTDTEKPQQNQSLGMRILSLGGEVLTKEAARAANNGGGRRETFSFPIRE